MLQTFKSFEYTEFRMKKVLCVMRNLTMLLSFIVEVPTLTRMQDNEEFQISRFKKYGKIFAEKSSSEIP